MFRCGVGPWPCYAAKTTNARKDQLDLHFGTHVYIINVHVHVCIYINAYVHVYIHIFIFSHTIQCQSPPKGYLAHIPVQR